MSVFLTYAYLFFIGSTAGWVLELFFRKFFSGSNPQHKWVNPGFCVGPYLPLYGFGLCALYTIAWLSGEVGMPSWAVVAISTVAMTAVEYVAGIMCLKLFKLRLWDYSKRWGNIQGLVCPLFSLFWGILGAAYLFLVHPHILDALVWLSENLAFSFVIGFFFGVFTIDVAHSANLVARIKKAVGDRSVIVELEKAKEHIRAFNASHHLRVHFLRPFKTESDFASLIRDFQRHNR